MNNIAALRMDRGLSMEALGEMIGASPSTVNRIEKGETELVSEWVYKCAEAFKVSPYEVLGWDGSMRALPEDAEPYVPSRDDPLASFHLDSDREMWRIKSRVLDAIGIPENGVIILHRARPKIEAVATGDAVLLNMLRDEEAAAGRRPPAYIRQFLEPDLFSTNSHDANLRPFNRLKDRVRILGIIESTVTQLRR